MNPKSKNLNEFERSYRKRMFFRYTVAVLALLLVIALLFGAGVFFRLKQQEGKFTVPDYANSDADSPDYWKDRTLHDIEVSRNRDTEEINAAKLQFLTANTLGKTQAITSNYARVTALADIAITLAKNDITVNIDEQLKFLADSPIGMSMQARILISQALMSLRTGNRSQARVLIQQYNRIVIEQDLKLNSEANEMSFNGAVTALAVLEDTARLSEIFDQQLGFSLRLQEVQQMRAFRFIAGEQARVGMSVYAMNTVKKIKTAVEIARAYQQIISFTARPKKPEPAEPSVSMPRTSGPWEPLQSPAVAKQIISDVLQQIAGQEELDTQIDIMMQLAGSRLMCDPEIHVLFREAVDNHRGFDNLVKRPVLKLLDNPDSDIIRESLGMPPLSKEKIKNMDPALDDWKSSTGAISVEVSRVDPETMKTINAQQAIRLYYMTAQCYLMINRHQDAVRVLQKAFAAAKELPDRIDRVTNLLRLGEKQLTARDFSAAKTSFLAVGLPDAAKPGSEQDIYSVETLSGIARLQTVGRFFDDAVKTIACISSSSVRDDDYAFLIKEYFRINRLIDAEQLITKISDTDRRTEMMHVLGIAKDSTEAHYKALNLPYPENTEDVNILKRVFERLLSYGLFNAAAQAAEKINDTQIRSVYLARAVREYMLLFRAYGEDSEAHRAVRKRIFEQADRTAHRIEVPVKRASALETMISAALPGRKKDQLQKKLTDLLAESLTAAQQSSSSPEEKGDVIARLILSKIVLESPEDSADDGSVSVPLIDKAKNPEQFDEIMKLISDTVVTVNEMNDVPKRGYAIAFLSKALGQIGRTKASLSMLKDAEEAAAGLPNAKDTVSLLLSLVPAYRSLNENDNVQRVYYAACNTVLEAYTATTGLEEATVEWRIRDSELERITSSQLEQNYVADAVVFTNRINEPLLKDRLLRTAAYIYLDKNEVERAEVIARKIKTPSVLSGTIRDVLFAKRTLVKLQNSKIETATKPVVQPVAEEKTEEEPSADGKAESGAAK